MKNVDYILKRAMKIRWIVFTVLFGLQALGYLSVQSLQLILIGWPSHFYFNHILAPLFDIAPSDDILHGILFFLGSFGVILYFVALFYFIGFIVEKIIIFIKMRKFDFS